jgi:YbgC/YbaW family acyl-CoA thioester hydrolase
MLRRFSTRLTVRIGDINYGGHLGNDKFLLYFHEARLRFLKNLGLSEQDIGEGVALTQVEAFLRYQGQAHLGDELEIAVCVSEFSRARFRFEYEITRPLDAKAIATGYTVMAGFDYQRTRPERIPIEFKQTVERFQNTL